jgi:hypothetical protein
LQRALRRLPLDDHEAEPAHGRVHLGRLHRRQRPLTHPRRAVGHADHGDGSVGLQRRVVPEDGHGIHGQDGGDHLGGAAQCIGLGSGVGQQAGKLEQCGGHARLRGAAIATPAAVGSKGGRAHQGLHTGATGDR